jgi:hypothetical protein
MDKMGRALGSAQRAFDDLSGPRTRQFEKQLEKLEAVRDARALPVDAVPAPAPIRASKLACEADVDGGPEHPPSPLLESRPEPRLRKAVGAEELTALQLKL